MTAPIAEPEVLTEVPVTLKKLVRYIVRGFYEVEHALIVDLLVHHPCLREEDLLELLKFEQKQLRTAINTLKSDKFVKVRMRMETNKDGRTNKQNYYFINYSTFVNVVKYKVDHMRRKIDMEERNMTSRASFKCTNCNKSFTDLEVGQLFDVFTGQMKCTYCQEEVEEDVSAQPKTDARTLMVRFNEQIEPIFSLLRQVEDVKLSPELLEPEPVDIKNPRGGAGSRAHGDRSVWSGDKKHGTFNYNPESSHMTVDIEGKDVLPAAPIAKEQPVWMQQSTVEGAVADENVVDGAAAAKTLEEPADMQESDEIFRTLLAHEKKASAPLIPGARPPPASDDSDSSDSETEASFKAIASLTQSHTQHAQAAPVEVMESGDDEESVPMVTVNNTRVPYHEVSEDMVQRMTTPEREAYIAVGQEMYNDMYD